MPVLFLKHERRDQGLVGLDADGQRAFRLANCGWQRDEEKAASQCQPTDEPPHCLHGEWADLAELFIAFVPYIHSERLTIHL